MASIVSAGTTNATALNMSADTSGVLQLASNNGTVAVTVGTDQNVGVGTTSPLARLHVDSGSAGELQRYNSSNTAPYVPWYISGTRKAYQQWDSAYGWILDSEAASTGILFRTQNIERMRISSAGYVTQPYQPMVVARASGNITPAAGLTAVPFTSTDINISSSFNTSTYIFTAPVAGYYLLSANITFNSAVASAYCGPVYYKNGGILLATYTNHVANNYSQGVSTFIVLLAASDTIQLYVDNQAASNAYEGSRTWMNIVLLG
jgi:hypothetical protein